MSIAGLLYDSPLFTGLFYKLHNRLKDTRLTLFVFSLFAGMLPVPGRVSLTAGVLDNIIAKDNDKEVRENLGIIDYLSSHHYYLWNPLEKTIIIPMAVLGLTYYSIITLIYPLLIITFLYIGVTIYFILPKDTVLKYNFSEEELKNIKFSLFDKLAGLFFIMSLIGIFFFNPAIVFGVLFLSVIGLKMYFYGTELNLDLLKQIHKTLNYWVLGYVAVSIILGNFIRESGVLEWFHSYASAESSFIMVAMLSFFVSFSLGSSSRFSGIVSYLTLIFGPAYFVVLFAIDFAGYLLSPVHKCVVISKTYFGTPIVRYYTVLIVWAVLLVSFGILQT